MSENNVTNATTTPTSTTPAPEASASSNGLDGTERAAHKRLYSTLADAQEAKPEGEHKMRVFQVFIHAKPIGYTWGTGVYDALINAAKFVGYAAKVAEPKGREVTKEAVASKLVEFTDEQLAELGLTRKKQKKGK